MPELSFAAAGTRPAVEVYLSQRFALSAIGQDRPGIVSSVTEVLYRHGCNLEDSAMTILRGQFAMILVVSTPASADQLSQELSEVSRFLGLHLSLSPLEESVAAAPADIRVPYLVSVYGADQPGIVSRTAGFLAERGVNITDLSTRVIHGKGPVYIMLLEAEAPASVAEEELRHELGSLSAELQVDITLRRLEEEPI